MAINLCFNLFFGIPPPDRFVPSQVTLPTWNIVLGEADKIKLQRKFNQSQYEFHIRTDDSIKGNTDWHVVGIHTWNNTTSEPEAYTGILFLQFPKMSK